MEMNWFMVKQWKIPQIEYVVKSRCKNEMKNFEKKGQWLRLGCCYIRKHEENISKVIATVLFWKGEGLVWWFRWFFEGYGDCERTAVLMVIVYVMLVKNSHE